MTHNHNIINDKPDVFQQQDNKACVSRNLNTDKLEIQKQWDLDPCGAVTVSSIPFNTHDYYRAIREHRYEVYAPWLLDAIPLQRIKNKNILEIGVGLGSDHYQLALHNTMTMLDLSKTHLECTQQHLQHEGLQSTPVYGDAENMPFEDHTFDVVYSFGALHHTSNIQKAINEVYRVLKPGGEAWIGLYNAKSWFFILCTFLISGIIKGNFIRKGWKKTLSMIEYRRDENTATPLVNVYTKKQCYNLFKNFETIRTSTHHVDFDHFYRFSYLAKKITTRNWLEKYLSFGGWYLIIHCKK